MFNIDSSEFLLVALVALVVIGPKDLPKAMRVVGYWVGRARAVGRQFRAGFDEMVREAELEEMEKKWKAENERIMREHPMIPPPPAEPAAPDTAAIEHAAIEHAAPVPAGPEYKAPEGDSTEHRPGDPAAVAAHDAAAANDAPPPVMVEQPRVVPGGPHQAPAADSKAAS